MRIVTLLSVTVTSLFDHCCIHSFLLIDYRATIFHIHQNLDFAAKVARTTVISFMSHSFTRKTSFATTEA